MVEAATEFKKSGYSEDDAATLAQVSSMFQNVADEQISAGEAANFLISQMIAFNVEAQDAITITDKINEVSNRFAVSSSDLATGLSVVASSSAAMGNSLDETMALMVAITEQTRNASKSARGVNTIMANLAQVLDDTSSNGEKITQIFHDLGVEMYENGQLKSGYDLLAGLSEKWNLLDTNTQKYIATTLAGTTQLNNFLALMNNFNHATDSLRVSQEAAGSAIRENAAYMESLEAKTTALKATFQDLANNVISNELIGGVLDLANAFLQLANTDLGHIVTQILLLSGVSWGAKSLLDATKILSVAVTQFKEFGAALSLIGDIHSLSSAFTLLGMSGGAVLPTLVGISAAIVGIINGAKAWKDANPSIEEATAQIKANTSQLETNKERLDELNSTPWYDRTREIDEEIARIEAENKILQEQIDKYTQLNKEKAKEAAGAEYKVYGGGNRYGVSSFSANTREELAESIYTIYGTDSKWADHLVKNIKLIGEAATESGEQLETHLVQIVEDYNVALANNASESTESIRAYNNNKETIDKLIESYRIIIDSGDTLTESQQALFDAVSQTNVAYVEAEKTQRLISTSLAETADEANNLISKYPELQKGLESCTSATIDAIAKNEILANQDMGVGNKIEALQNLINALGDTAIAAAFTAESLDLANMSYGEKMGRYGSTDPNQIYKTMWRTYFDRFQNKKAITILGSEASSTSSKSPTDKALEAFRLVQTDLKHQLEMGEIDQEAYYNNLEKLVEEYKKDATAHMKAYGLNAKEIAQNMYSYEEEIYKGRAQLAESVADANKKAAEETKKAWQESLESNKSDIEIAVSYVIDKIDEEISKLEAEKDEISDFYDKQIDALQSTNDELERQIEYEEKLNDLARAKSKGIYVFKDGQFQYAQDVDAISSAQSNLDAYKREEALRKETENLEKLKNQALADIDEQIAGWQDYRNEWANVTESYTNQQNKLIAEQVLGVDLEQANWEKRLANVQSFVNQYNAILSQLNALSIMGDSDSGDIVRSKDAKHVTKQSDYDALKAAGDKWNKATTDAERAAAHAEAEAIRKKYGYSGGSSGADYIPLYASGTTSAAGGLSVVGENGPELAVLGQGDGVLPADITRNLWDWGKFNPKSMMSTMSQVFNIDNLTLPNAHDAAGLITGLKQMAYQRAYKRA